MGMEQIRTDPDPYEPYRLSQGFRVGDLLFVSGQAAIAPEGELVGVGDFDAQAEQMFQNLVTGARGRRLEPRQDRQGDDLPDRHGELPEDRRAARPWFTPPYPADTIVEVSSLALPELEIEIEAIAVAPVSTAIEPVLAVEPWLVGVKPALEVVPGMRGS